MSLEFATGNEVTAFAALLDVSQLSLHDYTSETLHESMAPFSTLTDQSSVLSDFINVVNLMDQKCISV